MALPATEVVPSARRLVQSLRDIGYDVATALADLVDNSIAASARNVWIDLHFNGAGSWIRILDDGDGMRERALREAMRFGTQRTYGRDELGRFGLGLKSASLSQCRRLTVATRTAIRGRIRVARWDLDHIERSDRWEVLRPHLKSCPTAVEPLRFRTGTAIVWEGLDRINRYRFPDGRRAESDFEKVAADIEGHLAMTFHRYLAGETRSRHRINLYLNRKEISPWDPFSRDELATVQVPAQRLTISHRRQKHRIVVRPFVLPAESQFSTLAAHRRAAGPRFWTRQQGFYFYRNDRLIQAGGWSRLRTQDEHTKLARVAIDIPSAADDAFELTVSKTQVRIPASIRGELAAVASSTCRAAEEAYRRPRTPAGPEHADIAATRLDALATLVQMVVSALNDVLTQELELSFDLRNRLVARMRSLEAEVIDQAAARLGLSDSRPLPAVTTVEASGLS